MDPGELKYTAADLENAIPAMSPGLFQNWIARGVLPVSQQNPGRGASRLYSFGEAVTTEIMVQMALHGQPSKLSAAAGQAAARHVADYVAHGGKLTDLGEIEHEEWPFLVFNYLGEKLDYEIVKRCDLTDIQKLYYQVVDFMYIAIKLYSALETVREVRIRSGK